VVVEELIRHSELSTVDDVDVVVVVVDGVVVDDEATRDFCAEKNVGRERQCFECCCDRD
jgi:hypothetical protein